MRNSLRLSIGALALASVAACSKSSSPALPDDLKQDLAKAGGGDMQLAGGAGNRVSVVSAAELTERPTPAPKAPHVSKAPSAFHGTTAPVASVRHDTPAASQSATKAEDAAPAEAPQATPAPENVPSAGRPSAPRSTQPEPRGGWRSPGEIIRRAPFPINP